MIIDPDRLDRWLTTAVGIVDRAADVVFGSGVQPRPATEGEPAMCEIPALARNGVPLLTEITRIESAPDEIVIDGERVPVVVTTVHGHLEGEPASYPFAMTYEDAVKIVEAIGLGLARLPVSPTRPYPPIGRS